MQIIQFLSKKSSWLLLPLIIAVFSLLSISSCTKEEAKGPDGTCITLSRAKINNAWGKPGYLKDISYLTFVTSYNPVNDKFEVSVQAYKSDYTAIGGLVKLAIGNSCPTDLPPILVGENIQDFSELNILDSGGNLKNFKYISLTPTVEKLPCSDYKLNLLKFTTSVEGGDTEMPRIERYTLPCPPCINCRPVCEDRDTSFTPLIPEPIGDTTGGH